MSLPDFTRAEYVQPQVIEGEVLSSRESGSAAAPRFDARFGTALLYGTVAALVGAAGYALVGLTGFMVSIVAIGMAWLIAKAMMTATGGVGGRAYQVAAVVLTYLSVNLGELLHPLYLAHGRGLPFAAMLNPIVFKYLLFGPFVELARGLNGILGAVILAIGMRAAWRWAAGSPGFWRGAATMPMGPFGPR